MEADRRKEVTALASKLVERLAKGETLEALAKETGAKVEKTSAVTRSTSPPGLPQNAVQQAFALPKGGATSAPTADGKARIVLRVADVVPGAPAHAGADRPPEERARAPAAAGRSGRVRRRPADALRPLRQRCGPEAGAGQRPGASSRSTSERPRPSPGRTGPNDQARRDHDAIRGAAGALRLRRALSQGRAAGGVDAARRRPRDAGVGGAEAERRAAHELPAGIGGGRRRARALLDHRHRSGRRLARLRRPGRDQPAAADGPRRLRGRRAADARNRCARCWRSRASSCRPTCRRSPPA